MRVDLAGEGRQTCLYEQALLLLQLSLIARVVPDLKWDGDREECGGVRSGHGGRRRVLAGQRVDFAREGITQDLPEEFGNENSSEELQVKGSPPRIGALFKEAVDVQVEKRGEAPDLL